MPHDFLSIKNKGEEIKEWLKKETASLRTGRATPALVENIMVDSYGTRIPIKHAASITAEDARTIRITPWDASVLKNIEHSISASALGVQPIADKQSIRITLPELTEERRKSLIKLLNEKLEEAKVSLKLKREEEWKDIQEKERSGEISEDDKFRSKDELQKIIEKISDELEGIAKNKEREILS
ncbi:ribosome recycling factor [Patescibacteria group bacterium]|nr:ribosome recycling factor [Patescibacteria group bacterium]